MLHSPPVFRGAALPDPARRPTQVQQHRRGAARPAPTFLRLPSFQSPARYRPMRLTLLIPELLWSEPGDTEANAPASRSALAKILAQRRFVRQTNVGWEASLLRLAGLRPESSLAVLRARGETGAMLAEPIDPADARRWLCADPVHLRFHQDRLILADGHELALRDEELAALASRLNAALAGRAEFFFSGPLRGYARLAASPRQAPAAGQPLSRKIGREVRPGDFGDAAELRGLANEIQMLLHADPVNEARAAAGQPTVNALWLWGAGEVPGAAGSASDAIDAIAGEHPLIAGIANTLAIPQLDAAATGARRTRHTLHFIDALNVPTHYQNSLDYAAAWQALDSAHLGPALGALRQWQLQRVDVVAPVVFGEVHWQVSPLNAWTGRLGRRSWADLVAALAEPGLTEK